MSNVRNKPKTKRHRKVFMQDQARYRRNVKRANDLMCGLLLGFITLHLFSLAVYTDNGWLLLLSLFLGLCTVIKLGGYNGKPR